MNLAYEILHVVGGRVFDAESYELTTALGRAFAQRESGYYLTRLVAHEEGSRVDAWVGPFEDLRRARMAASELAAPPRVSGDDLH